jgi:hypothetical protein
MHVEVNKVSTTIFTPSLHLVAWGLVIVTFSPMTHLYAWNWTLLKTMATQTDRQPGTRGTTMMVVAIKMAAMAHIQDANFTSVQSSLRMVA